MSNVTDEKLLKRAKDGGRNLMVLAVLASCLTGVLWAVAVKPDSVFGLGFAIGLTLVSLGYWFLAVAAKRGDPRSHYAVLIVVTLSIALTFVARGASAGEGDATGGSASWIVMVLILIALASSYKTLDEIKKRGLQNQAFPKGKPTTTLCVAGSTLFVAGMIGVNVVMFTGLSAAQATNEQEAGLCKTFVAMVEQDQPGMLTALNEATADPSAANCDKALKVVRELKRRAAALASEASEERQPIRAIVQSYIRALDSYERGIAQAASPDADVKKIQDSLGAGDQFMKNAIGRFNEVYVAE
jgi:hypothetical protein